MVELHPALASALRADREVLNQRFALRQRMGARIDETAFYEHLRTVVNDLVRIVADLQLERVRSVVHALFDASLDLFAAGLLGPDTKHPHVALAWREVLPQAARLLARDPARVVGSLSNAVDHISMYPAARPAEWIGGMSALSPQVESVSQWLDVGKILAWRSGLVQYRAAALELLAVLPWKLAAACLNLGVDVTEAVWRAQLLRLQSDRWYSPKSDNLAERVPSLQIVHTTGGFRGFGGPCLRPPMVRASDAELLVSDGHETWQLIADAFGTLWQPVPNGSPTKKNTVRSPAAIDETGKITWNKVQQFSELAEPSSFACDGQTLAVTLRSSYLVFLVAQVA